MTATYNQPGAESAPPQAQTYDEAEEICAFPSMQQLETIRATKRYTIAPVACEFPAHTSDPLDVLSILKRISHHVYVLESAQQAAQGAQQEAERGTEATETATSGVQNSTSGAQNVQAVQQGAQPAQTVHGAGATASPQMPQRERGRYTFLGFDPKRNIYCEQGKLTIDDVHLETQQPTDIIRSILHEYRSPHIDRLPPFTGGLVGYFSFEFLGYKEPKLANNQFNEGAFRDLDLMLFDKVITFDNLTHRIVLIINIKLNNLEENYQHALMELDSLKRLIMQGKKQVDKPGNITGSVKALFSKEQFCAMVASAKQHIVAGDIFQIVLSNQLSAPFSGSLLSTYRRLRTINPSPYMFYFSGDDMEIAGASPETLVDLKDGVLHTYPLAGTRKRGASPQEDMVLEQELLHDEKELAEHNMLVDLGRNDLGRISAFGSVVVERLHSIERFSHVMHIGSAVRSRIDAKHDALDAVEALMPAGTLSGAPKIKACELIGALEGTKRGIYGGAIGYVDFTGNMDMCIGIRLLYKKAGRVVVQTGAGIVADSIAENEYQECLNKARSSLAALEEQPDDAAQPRASRATAQPGAAGVGNVANVGNVAAPSPAAPSPTDPTAAPSAQMKAHE